MHVCVKKSRFLTNKKMIEGQSFVQADFWLDVFPPENKPINYLEIGAHSCVNVLSVARLYASHPNSRIWCVDPWTDYDQYREYKGQQEHSYGCFTRNIDNFELAEKVTALRGFSHEKIPELQDDFFDIIYIDGNHEPDFVMEDAVLSFRKLKVGGVLIVDDYGFDGPDGTSRGIDGFLSGYHKRIEVLRTKWTTWGLAQVFVKKI
jgi:hypothetical protein